MIIKRTLTRDLADRSRIVAHLELRIAENGERLVDGLSPAFSATCEVYEPHGTWSGAARHRSREPDCSGALTEEIARAFPKLKPITDLHLSAPDGVPMHAEANGWYWYSSFDGKGTHGVPGRTDYEVACDCLRLPRGGIPCPQSRDSFRRLVDDQRERWAREAATARALLESLPKRGIAMTDEAKTYRIRRFHRDDSHPDHHMIVKTGLTLQEAQEHCNDPATSGRDAQGQVEWFDGYDEE